MPFAGTWMGVEMITLSEVSERERQISYDITYMRNIKRDTNELIHETETDSETWRTDLWLPRRRWMG